MSSGRIRGRTNLGCRLVCLSVGRFVCLSVFVFEELPVLENKESDYGGRLAASPQVSISSCESVLRWGTDDCRDFVITGLEWRPVVSGNGH